MGDFGTAGATATADPWSTAEGLVKFLDSMRFMLRVEVADVSEQYAPVWQPVTSSDDSLVTWSDTKRLQG